MITGDRTWLHYTPDQSSIHDNSSPSGKMFAEMGTIVLRGRFYAARES